MAVGKTERLPTDSGRINIAIDGYRGIYPEHCRKAPPSTPRTLRTIPLHTRPLPRVMIESRMLNERAQILLKTLMERYISDGQPFGSRVLQQYSGLDVSSATIRNTMADFKISDW